MSDNEKPQIVAGQDLALVLRSAATLVGRYPECEFNGVHGTRTGRIRIMMRWTWFFRLVHAEGASNHVRVNSANPAGGHPREYVWVFARNCALVCTGPADATDRPEGKEPLVVRARARQDTDQPVVHRRRRLATEIK